MELQGESGSTGQVSFKGHPSLLLYFIAALTEQQRRRLIGDCSDQAGSDFIF